MEDSRGVYTCHTQRKKGEGGRERTERQRGQRDREDGETERTERQTQGETERQQAKGQPGPWGGGGRGGAGRSRTHQTIPTKEKRDGDAGGCVCRQLRWGVTDMYQELGIEDDRSTHNEISVNVVDGVASSATTPDAAQPRPEEGKWWDVGYFLCMFPFFYDRTIPDGVDYAKVGASMGERFLASTDATKYTLADHCLGVVCTMAWALLKHYEQWFDIAGYENEDAVMKEMWTTHVKTVLNAVDSDTDLDTAVEQIKMKTHKIGLNTYFIQNSLSNGRENAVFVADVWVSLAQPVFEAVDEFVWNCTH